MFQVWHPLAAFCSDVGCFDSLSYHGFLDDAGPARGWHATDWAMDDAGLGLWTRAQRAAATGHWSHQGTAWWGATQWFVLYNQTLGFGICFGEERMYESKVKWMSEEDFKQSGAKKKTSPKLSKKEQFTQEQSRWRYVSSLSNQRFCNVRLFFFLCAKDQRWVGEDGGGLDGSAATTAHLQSHLGAAHRARQSRGQAQVLHGTAQREGSETRPGWPRLQRHDRCCWMVNISTVSWLDEDNIMDWVELGENWMAHQLLNIFNIQIIDDIFINNSAHLDCRKPAEVAVPPSPRASWHRWDPSWSRTLGPWPCAIPMRICRRCGTAWGWPPSIPAWPETCLWVLLANGLLDVGKIPSKLQKISEVMFVHQLLLLWKHLRIQLGHQPKMPTGC